MNTPIVSLRLLLLGCLLTSAQAAYRHTNTFANDSDYDSHFVELTPSGTVTLGLETYGTGERGLRKRGTGVQSAIFDNSAGGGSAGSGGTTGSKADATLFRTALEADLRFLNLNAATAGFWAQVSSDYAAGYLGDITILTSTTVRLRIYDNDSNPTANTVGTSLLNQTITVPAGITLSTTTFYRGSFKATPGSSGNLQLDLALTLTDGTPVVAATVTDTTTPLAIPGQAGFRFASEGLILDNFALTSASVVNIQAAPYFARGDDSTNNRAAFAAALTDLLPGDVLFVPRGTYRLTLNSSTLVQPAGTTILGESGASIVKLENGGSTTARQFLRPGGNNVLIDGLTFERVANFPLVVFPLYHSNNPSGITIRNCSIIGNRDIYTGYYCHGFETGHNTVSNVLLENLFVTTCNYGLFGSSAATGSLNGITVHNSQFYRNYATDLEFNAPNSYAANVVVTDCHFRDNQATAASAGWAVGLAEIHTATVQDCFISDYNRAGIHVEDHSEDVLISGNTLVRTAVIGDNPLIVLSASNDIALHRNIIDARENSRSGMHLILVTAGGVAYSVPTNVNVTDNLLVNGPSTTTWYLQSGSGPSPSGNIVAP